MPNFRDAAQRHWDDAEYLLGNQRLPNADQLYGLSAECALKAIMQAAGELLLLENGKPEEQDMRRHIDKIWEVFLSFSNNRTLTHYAEALENKSNSFKDNKWSIAQRYEDGSKITPEIVRQHKEAASSTIKLLLEAELDGLLS
jgi:hypothetical protein